MNILQMVSLCLYILHTPLHKSRTCFDTAKRTVLRFLICEIPTDHSTNVSDRSTTPEQASAAQINRGDQRRTHSSPSKITPAHASRGQVTSVQASAHQPTTDPDSLSQCMPPHNQGQRTATKARPRHPMPAHASRGQPKPPHASQSKPRPALA